MKKTMRIKIVNKKRFTAFCTVLALICVVSASLVFGGNNHVEAASNEYTMIYVGEGDSLWSIVKENYSENVNIRSIISEIKDLNGMASSTIYPGDILYIPVY